MTWGGVRYPWESWPILSFLIASALLWGLFAWHLGRAVEPFIPPSVLREPVVAGNVAAGFFSIGAIIGLSIYLPLYLELVLGASASLSGSLLIAFTVGTVLGAFAAGRGLGRHRHYKRIPVAGLVLAIAVLLVLALARDLSAGCIAGLLFLCGGGIGTMYPVTTVLTQNAVQPHQFGVATGTVNFFRLLGGTIVVAGFGAIVLSSIDPAGGLVALDRFSHGAARPEGMAAADFAAVFAWVFAAAAGCLAAALVALAFIEERPLRGATAHALEDVAAPARNPT
jgi:predicted MFS family arabinose efflux permease